MPRMPYRKMPRVAALLMLAGVMNVAHGAAPLKLDDPASDFVINGEDLLLSAPGGEAWLSVRMRKPVQGLNTVNVGISAQAGLPVSVSAQKLSFNALNWVWPQKIRLTAGALASLRQQGWLELTGTETFTGRTVKGRVQLRLENFTQQAWQPTYDSLARHKLPTWYKDAKLGFFVHWTVSSVPAYANPDGLVGFDIDGNALAGNLIKNRFYPELAYGEWYRSNMQDKQGQTWAYHVSHYGSGWDYYDFVERFNAQQAQANVGALAQLIADAGGRYTVFVAKHHEGVDFFSPSVVHSRQAVTKQVAARDTAADVAAAVRARGMRFGLYYSGYFDWAYSKKQFMHGDASASLNVLGSVVEASTDQNFRALVRAHYFDLIDRYQPDLLWNDLAFIGNPYEVQAYYFNRKPDGVVNDRWKSPVRFYDSAFEKQRPNPVYEGLMASLQSAINTASINEPVTPSVSKVFSDFDTHEYIDFPQTAYPNGRYFEGTRGVGRSFAYTANDTAFSSGDALIHLLVDVVSKNGNLLLNIGPKPDGSVPDQQAQPLRELGRWLAVHGAGIYGTRPWRIDRALSREGDKLQFTTDQAGNLFVFVDQALGRDKTLTLPDVLVDTSVSAAQAVSVLGRGMAPVWVQEGGDLKVVLPYQATPGTSSSLVAIKVRLNRSAWAAYLASSSSYWR